jgi:hypothetical protein
VKQSGDLTPNFYFHNDEFSVVTYYESGVGGHALAVVKNIYNGINYANYLNYRFFFYLECDNLFAQEDLPKIQILKNSMFLKSKHMIIFNHMFNEHPIYETLIFGGNPKYFLENIFLPKTDDEFLGQKMSLEDFFHFSHKNLEESFYIVPSPSDEYFTNSRINKLVGHIDGSVFGNYFIGLYGSNDFPNLYLFIRNHNKEIIEFKINDSEVNCLDNGAWSLNKISLKSNLIVTIITEGIEVFYEYDLDEKNILNYYKKGFIHFN